MIDPNAVTIVKVSSFPGAGSQDGLFFHMVRKGEAGANYAVSEALYRRTADSYDKTQVYTKSETNALVTGLGYTAALEMVSVTGVTISNAALANKDVVAIVIDDITKNKGFTKVLANNYLTFTDGTTLTAGDNLTIFYV